MCNQREPIPSDDQLIDASVIQSTANELAEGPDEQIGVLASEPVLLSFLRDRLNVVAGKLVLAGAPQPMVAGVACDVQQLLALTATIVRNADRALLDDLLPDFDAPVHPPKTEKNDAND